LIYIGDPYDRNSLDPRLYISPVEQYNRGMCIPVQNLKLKLKKPGHRHNEDLPVVEMGPQHLQGYAGSAVENHVATFNAHSLRMCNLVNKLFE
jgi:hypothetical protein